MEGNFLASKSTGILVVGQEFQTDLFFFLTDKVPLSFPGSSWQTGSLEESFHESL